MKAQQRFAVWTLGAAALAFFLGSVACSDQNKGSGFVGTARKLTVKGVVTQSDPIPEQDVIPAPTPRSTPTLPPNVEIPAETPAANETPADSAFSVEDFEFRTRVNRAEAWVVVHTRAHRIELDELRGFPRTEWNIPNVTSGSGHRTFVSEIGLLIGKTYEAGNSLALDGTSVGTQAAGIYRVSDDNPGDAKLIYQPTDWGSPTRICVTSFRVGTKAYVGAAYRTAAGKRKFIRFPIDKSKPNKVDTSLTESVEVGDTTNPHASYSCFVDQARGYFWVGGYRGAGGDLWGVDYVNMQPLALDKEPNFSHTTNVLTLTHATSNSSYALAGDGEGNLLTASGMYTFAHEAVSDVVFGTVGNLTVTRGDCFRKLTDCTGKHWSFGGAQGVPAMGPLSSLNDGRVVGIARGADSTAFLLELADKTDPSKGLRVKNIATVPGNAYMYTDFTGATLYPADVHRTISLQEASEFRPGVKVVDLKLKWTAESGQAEAWRGLKLEVRCFDATANTKPAFAEVTGIAAAGTAFDVTLGMCRNAIFDTVEIQVSGSGSTSAFSRTKSIVVLGHQ